MGVLQREKFDSKKNKEIILLLIISLLMIIFFTFLKHISHYNEVLQLRIQYNGTTINIEPWYSEINKDDDSPSSPSTSFCREGGGH